MTDLTYRLISLSPDCDITGQTALTPELAKLVPGGLAVLRSNRLGIERTDWDTGSGKPRAVRSVLIDAETFPCEWTIGAASESKSFFTTKKKVNTETPPSSDPIPVLRRI
jgi:hypothetical protein